MVLLLQDLPGPQSVSVEMKAKARTLTSLLSQLSVDDLTDKFD